MDTIFEIKTNHDLKKFYIYNTNLMNLSTKNFSYNAFIITNDKKLIVCYRKRSFYFDFMKIICLKIFLFEKFKKKLINCLYNLYLNEISSLIFYIFNDKNFFYTKDCYSDLIKININILFVDKDLYKHLLYIKENFKNYLSTKCIILPGGKYNKNETNITQTDVLLREISEEIGLNLKEIEIKNYHFSDSQSKKCNIEDMPMNIISNIYQIKPILITYIHDHVLNKYYYDITYLIDLNFSSQEILNIFRPNVEIHKIYFVPLALHKNYLYSILQTYSILLNNIPTTQIRHWPD